MPIPRATSIASSAKIGACAGHRIVSRWSSMKAWVMLEGITAIVAGIATLVRPSITTFVLAYLIAAWAIIAGIFQILAAIERRQVIVGARWSILSGNLSVVLGLVLALQPTAAALARVRLN